MVVLMLRQVLCRRIIALDNKSSLPSHNRPISKEIRVKLLERSGDPLRRANLSFISVSQLKGRQHVVAGISPQHRIPTGRIFIYVQELLESRSSARG